MSNNIEDGPAQDSGASKTYHDNVISVFTPSLYKLAVISIFGISAFYLKYLYLTQLFAYVGLHVVLKLAGVYSYYFLSQKSKIFSRFVDAYKKMREDGQEHNYTKRGVLMSQTTNAYLHNLFKIPSLIQDVISSACIFIAASSFGLSQPLSLALLVVAVVGALSSASHKELVTPIIKNRNSPNNRLCDTPALGKGNNPSPSNDMSPSVTKASSGRNGGVTTNKESSSLVNFDESVNDTRPSVPKVHSGKNGGVTTNKESSGLVNFDVSGNDTIPSVSKAPSGKNGGVTTNKESSSLVNSDISDFNGQIITEAVNISFTEEDILELQR